MCLSVCLCVCVCLCLCAQDMVSFILATYIGGTFNVLYFLKNFFRDYPPLINLLDLLYADQEVSYIKTVHLTYLPTW